MYVILASNSDRKVQVFGTPEGRAIRSERTAKKSQRQLQAAYPLIDFLVLPIEPLELAPSALDALERS